MKKRANPDSEANIRRIDSKARAAKQTHGFQVHFLRGAQAVTRMFSDTIYGGKEQARRAARKFRRDAMVNLPGRIYRGPVGAEKAKNGRAASAKSVGSKSRAKAKAAGKKRAVSSAGQRR